MKQIFWYRIDLFPKMGIHSWRKFLLSLAGLIMFMFIAQMQKYNVPHVSYSIRNSTDYRHKILKETAPWRGFPKMCNSGYCGPWVEEYFFEHFSVEHTLSDRVYLPIFWTSCNRHCTKFQKIKLRKYLSKLNSEYKYFTIIQVARGLHHPNLNFKVPDDIDILFFSAGGRTHSKRGKNIIIPLLKAPIQRKGLPKTRFVSFVGSLHTDSLRKKLKRKYWNTFYFAKSKNWIDIMESSVFSLCPRGYGATSFRLAEAIMVRSIPIYVWREELMLPYSEVIDWNTFSIVVHENEIDKIPAKVNAINSTEFLIKLEKMAHFFTYDKMVSYVTSKITSAS